MTDANAQSAQDSERANEAPADEKTDAALWAEFDESEGVAPAAPEAAAEAAPADEKSADEAKASDAGAADEPEAKPNADSAATEIDDQKSPTTEETKPAAAPDIWAAATPEQRAAFDAARADRDKLEQYKRSNEGRLAALQRQIKELRGTQRPAKAAATAADAKPGDASAEGILGSSEWKSLETEYPEVAKPIGKVIANLEAQVTRQQKELSAIGDDRRQAALSEQEALLVKAHPDWLAVTEEPAFLAWLDEQPRHMQEAARRNADAIVDAREAADVVGRFKDFKGGSAQPTAGRGASPGPSTTATQPLSGKRQRQLDSASAARSRGPGVANGIPAEGDPEVMWKQFDELDRRQGSRG